MEFGNLYVLFGKDEEPLAKDIMAGRAAKVVLPYKFTCGKSKEFLIVAEDMKPCLAIAKITNVSYATLEDLLVNAVADGLGSYFPMLGEALAEDSNVERIFTIIDVGEVIPVPMDFVGNLASRYLKGELTEEGDTEGNFLSEWSL